MKLIATLALVVLTTAPLTNSFAAKGGSHSVKGHVTKSGTYVAPHRATNRDNTKSNNWSQKGNVNPYTGKEGTKN